MRKCIRGAGRAAVCAPAARGRGESGEQRGGEGRGQQREGTGQRDSIADGTALRNIVGEEVAATFGDTEDLFPEGSLFMSLRAIGYLLTHAECLLSVRQKKEILRSKDKDVRFTELLIGGERKKSFGQPVVNEVNTLLKEKSQKVGMSQQEQSLV